MSPCFRVKTGGREILPDDQVQYGFSAVGLFTEKDVPLSGDSHRLSTPEVMA